MFCAIIITQFEKKRKKAITFIDCIVFSLSMKAKKKSKKEKQYHLLCKKIAFSIKKLKKKLNPFFCLQNLNNPPKFESKFKKMMGLMGYHMCFSTIHAIALYICGSSYNVII